MTEAPTALRQQVRRARGKFVAMAASYSLGVFNDNFFKQAAMLLALDAHRRYLQGWALVLFTLPYLVVAAPAGWLADRFPKRRVVIAAKGLEVAAIVCGAVGLLTGNWALILTMVCTMGLQSAIFGPSLNGSIPELYPASYVTTANGVLKVFVTGAILLGVALAGPALDVPGHAGGVAMGRIIVAAAALAVAALGLLASLGVPHRPAADPSAPFPRTGPLETFRTLGACFRDRLLGVTILADAFIWFVGSLQVLLINALGRQQLGLSKTMTGVLPAAVLCGIAAGGLLAPRITRRPGWHRRLILLALALCVLMLLVPAAVQLPAGRRFWALLAVLAASGVAGGLFMIPCESFIQVRPRPQQKGTVIATSNFVVFVGIMASGVLEIAMTGGQAGVRSLILPSDAFYFLAGLSLAAAVALHFALPRGRGEATIDIFLRGFAKFAVSLRYRVRTIGMDRVATRGTQRILFLPSHPALIDPIILGAVLHKAFHARFLADRDQIDRFFIRALARRVNVVPIPDPAKGGTAAREEVVQGLRRCVEALRAGDNLVLYPAGQILRGRHEDLSGNSAVEMVLRRVPDVRVVLVRTRGLWGSRFSYAWGKVPHVSAVLREAVGALAAGGLVMVPKRDVTIEFHEPADFPRAASREELNAWLEAFYNADAPPATYVPYRMSAPARPREMPEPDFSAGRGELADVPEATRRIVLDYLRERTGVGQIADADHLARDLGMDSLARAEMLAWLSGEFGLPAGDVEALETVGDAMLAACGESFSARLTELKPVPARWFAPPAQAGPAVLPDGRTICEVFLAQARRGAGRVITADQRSGLRTYRDVVIGVLVLKDLIAALPGERVGIMLPAGVAADVVYLAALFAGKTPVMVNWTVGPRNLVHCLELVGVERVLTAEALVARLGSTGVDLSGVAEKLAPLERLAAGASKAAKLRAWARARLSWAALDAAAARVKETDVAAVLFTSGSEALPKAVPLTHANVLANVRDIAAMRIVRAEDRLLGILPPFHSFGLTVTTVLPLCLGVPVAHHPDPTEAPALARLIAAYRATLMVGTPTFLGAIARAGTSELLAPLRLAVTGAEKCPDRVYDLLERVNPRMEVLEGYGVTECSPIVSVNRPGETRRGTIGRPLPSVEHAIVDVDTHRRVAPGERGMLLVRGPSVFAGYLHHDGPSPFEEFDGRQWYRTGDLVVEDAGGVLTFRGRLKRFVKLGGEMISLPAIEAVLLAGLTEPAEDEGPPLAVEATSDEAHPEIVLFTRVPLTREAANRRLRAAGLSPLHNIRRVVTMDDIPVLGTGKTDYRALKARLAGGA